MFFSTKPKITHGYEPNRHFPEDTLAKNYFPWNVIFSPAISQIHKSTKVGFPRNRPKMVQLHKNIEDFHKYRVGISKKNAWQ